MNIIKVNYFQRKPIVGYYSLEFIANELKKILSNNLNINTIICKYDNSGLLKKIYNLFNSYFLQGKVNHIIGDIHYISILFKRNTTILTIADCTFMENRSYINRIIFKYLWLYLPSKRVYRIVAISHYTKKKILEYLPSLSYDKINVIYVPISTIFKPSYKVFNKYKPRILHIGTAQNKNLSRLIKALKGLSCQLVIIGKLNQTYFTELQNNNIDYLNYYNLSENEIFQQYCESDIVSFISTYEGFGMPIIEANVTGRVVITSNLASMPEIAGNAAKIINPYNIEDIRIGFLDLIHNDDYRNNFITNGFTNALRFDSNYIANQYFDLYKEINDKYLL